jgi:adenylate kinase family enzyme
MKTGGEKLTVVALVGCCGAGKSTLARMLPNDIQRFEDNYANHDHNEVDPNNIHIDNELHLSKFRYLNDWYLRIIKLAGQKSSGTRIVVSDRCPYDVGAYVARGDVFFELARHCQNELEQFYKVRMIKVYCRAEFDVLFGRIQTRLTDETWRTKYHENDESFVRRTFDYFEQRNWDHILDCNQDVETIKSSLLAIVSSLRPASK